MIFEGEVYPIESFLRDPLASAQQRQNVSTSFCEGHP